MTVTDRPIDDVLLDRYRQDGYLVWHRQVFSPERYAGLRGLCEELYASVEGPESDELNTPHFRDDRFLDYLLADEVLDLVEPIVGPDIVLWSSHLIAKNPGGVGTPWHEDSAYWSGRLSDFSSIVTVWLALDPTWADNGALRVIPGSHLADPDGRGTDRVYVVDPERPTFEKELAEVDEASAVTFELGPGEASLHDGRIIHGTRPNSSRFRRAGYTMRYMPADVRMDPEACAGHRLWLARGQDRAGNAYANT